MIAGLDQINCVDIIVINDAMGSFALRSILESFNIQSRMHYIGNVKHLISLFKAKDYLHKTIIISCHGGTEGLLIPELSEELEEKMPFHKALSASSLYEILNLNNSLVINTGCCLGKEEFAQSFIAKGANTYIGATDYIEATAMLMFVINFAYFHFVLSLSPTEAFNKALSIGPSDERNIAIWR